ncbi:MAG: hypothetical protein Kow0056_16640 [Coriobacteriia bacterium]
MSARRATLLFAVTALLAAAFLLYQEPPPAQTQPYEVIELTGQVEASKCAPCHLRIAEAKVPGLIFTHGNHLMIGCYACHSASPHAGGGTQRPTMDSCFNCHGITHGPSGQLATDACEDCHTPSFELRPRDHGDDWAEKPHADAAREEASVNRCMMCHDAPADCDECHAEQGLDLGPLPPQYLPVLRTEPQPPAVKVFPQERVTMGQCVYCHPDVDDFMPDRVIFEHADHLRRNYACDVCHTVFPHDNEQILVPNMEGCYRCHGLTHAASGLIAREECEACHPPEFDLRPENHTDEFVAGQHKERAADDGAYCGMCHVESFCIECHQGRKLGPDGKPLPAVVPADHKVAEWYGRHGELYLEQQGMCGACHESESCTTCHQTPMPHPTDWLETHGQQDGGLADDCNVCHVDRNRCQNCHHDTVKRAELIEENCKPCHDQMSHKPATEIRQKQYAEHAVHFNVAEVKGEPYKCYECHVSFGSSEVARQAEILQGHDLRLCYTCHGALDVQNRQIAPWPGKELCVRCHTDLNV